MRQGFLGLASLAGRGGDIRAHGVVGAASGRSGCSDITNAIGGHVFGLHQIDLDVIRHNRTIQIGNEKAPSGGTEGGFSGVLAALCGAQTLGTTLPSHVGQAF